MNDFPGAPASITVNRRIEWMDTDAAGIYHWTTVCRLAEAAETELHRALGIMDLTFGVSPRVSVHFDFKKRLRFDDPVAVELVVTRVGRSSVTYHVTVRGPEGVAAAGELVTCITDRQTGSPVKLPDRMRDSLATAGPQPAAGTEATLSAEGDSSEPSRKS